jgi:hypothetical protein
MIPGEKGSGVFDVLKKWFEERLRPSIRLRGRPPRPSNRSNRSNRLKDPRPFFIRASPRPFGGYCPIQMDIAGRRGTLPRPPSKGGIACRRTVVIAAAVLSGRPGAAAPLASSPLARGERRRRHRGQQPHPDRADRGQRSGNYDLDEVMRQPDSSIVAVCEVHSCRDNTIAKIMKAATQPRPGSPRPEALQRLPRGSGPQGRRRGDHRDDATPALPHGRRRRRGRQAFTESR